MRLPIAMAAVLLLPAAAAAQGVAFGVKGGVNLAGQQVSGTGAPSPSMRIGPIAGGFVTLPLGRRFGLDVEGLYSSKGAKVTALGIETTVQIDYFEVPVLLRVNFGEGSRRYFVAGGIAPAVRLRAKARTPFSGSTEEIDVADEVERFDAGVSGAGGVEAGRFVFDARYTFGFTNADANAPAGSRTRNHALAVTAGVRF
jgi:Outer membrane protein beta-barrel domain